MWKTWQLCSVTLPVLCCTVYLFPWWPYTWQEGDFSSIMQRKQHTGVADIPPAAWFGGKWCCLARNEQWPPSRASGFLPTAAGVIHPLLRTGMEICHQPTVSGGFLSINLADQATGKSSESGPKGFSTWPYWCSQLAEAMHAAPSFTHLQSQNAIKPAFPRLIKIPKPAPFLWGWICLVLEIFVSTTNNCRKAWPQLPSHPYRSFFA